MESTFKNKNEPVSNTKNDIEKLSSSVAEHEENMGVLYLQFSHLARTNEQLLELDLLQA